MQIAKLAKPNASSLKFESLLVTAFLRFKAALPFAWTPAELAARRRCRRAVKSSAGGRVDQFRGTTWLESPDERVEGNQFTKDQTVRGCNYLSFIDIKGFLTARERSKIPSAE